ncbi:MAG: ATP-binding cassette domain-containing protein [Enterocloster sp.]
MLEKRIPYESTDGGRHGCGHSLADPGIRCDGTFCFQSQLPYPGAFSDLQPSLRSGFPISWVSDPWGGATELEKGREAARRQYEADLYQARVNLFSQPFIYTSEAFLKALFLIYGGFLISRGELESGEFITIYMYLEMLPVFAIQYIFAYQTLKETQGASMRAGQLLLEPAEDLQKGDSLETLCQDIRFQDVSFRYGDRPVLSRATFTVPAGTTTAIVGPSGSGKTTVLQLLERFFVPDEGCILLGKRRSGISA